MSYSFKSATCTASTTGAILHQVGPSNTISIIGCRAANSDATAPHTFHITIDNVLISGIETPLPIGSAIDIMVGSKIIVEPNSIIMAHADANNAVDVYMSYLEQ